MFTDALRLAVAKAYNEKATKEIRENVAPGQYQVDGLVRLKGVLTVGEDTTASRPQSLCLLTALTLALSKLNPTTAASVLDEVVAAYNEGREINTDDVKKSVEKATARLVETTRASRKGTAKYVGDVEIVKQVVKTCVA